MKTVAWARRWSRSAIVLSVLVLVVGLLVSAGVAVALARQQKAAAADKLDQQAALVTAAVAAETGRYVDALRTVAGAAGAFEPLTATKFAEATAPLTDMGLAGATSIAYLVPTTDADLAAVQTRWRTRGVPELTLQPKASRGEHIFSIFSRPLDGTSTARYGIDVTQSAPPTHALTEARRSGKVTVSEAYQLIIDQQLPVEQRQQSFSLTAPVYGPADASGRREFRGWVLMGLRGRDFIGATLTGAAQGLLDVTLSAPGAQDSTVVVAAQRATTGNHRDLQTQATIDVADRQWHLAIAADGRALLPHGGVMLTVITAALAVLSLALAALVYVLATGRARAQTKVHEATAELAAAEAEARQQADLLSAVLDNISDGVGVVDHEGRFLLHNPAAKHILGLDADTDGTENWQDHYGMFTPDGVTPFPQADMPLVRALTGEHTDHIEMIIRNAGHPQGVTISVSARPLPTADGHRGAVAVFHDITARKTAEAELAAAGDTLRAELAARTTAEDELRAARDALADQKTYLTQVLDAIDVTVITCDTTGTIMHANRTARRAMPADADAASVATATARVGLTHPDGALVAVDDTPLMRALRGEHVDGMEATIALPDGSSKALLLHARPLTDTAGELIGAVAASYNVTALRDREADLRAFAGVAAHDLKAPLAAVAGYAEILDEDLLDTTTAPMVRTSLTRIRSGVDRMRRLIDDLLHYATARDADLHLQPVDLNDVVTDVIAERTAHLRSTTTDGQPVLFPDIYTGPLPTVHADRAMIRQLLDNLIGNAIKYAVPGQPARIDISAHHRPGDTQARIVIADRGIGIPDSEKPHVFATFRRAANHGDRPGTGLGLAICHRIIDRHHGSIAVTDNPGGGTRFHVTLPAAPARAAGPHRPCHRTDATTVKPPEAPGTGQQVIGVIQGVRRFHGF
jgi:PAS domain S-box-containing protein